MEDQSFPGFLNELLPRLSVAYPKPMPFRISIDPNTFDDEIRALSYHLQNGFFVLRSGLRLAVENNEPLWYFTRLSEFCVESLIGQMTHAARPEDHFVAMTILLRMTNLRWQDQDSARNTFVRIMNSPNQDSSLLIVEFEQLLISGTE